MADSHLIEPGFEENESCSDSLPECVILSPPLQDPYESDNSLEHKFKKQFLYDMQIGAAQVLPWELQHFLHFKYISFVCDKEMENISAEDLLQEAFKMFFNDSLPLIYLNKFNLENETLKSVTKILYEKFIHTKANSWFMEHFDIDYTIEKSPPDIADVRFQLLEDLQKSCRSEEDEDILEAPYLLACRFAMLMDYFSEDNERNFDHDGSHETNEKHELIKGVLYQMLAYVGVPVIFNGEGTYDFVHGNIPERCVDEPLHFEIKPHMSIYIETNGDREPFGVAEVYAPYGREVLQEIKEASEDNSAAIKSDENDETAAISRDKNDDLLDIINPAAGSTQEYVRKLGHTSDLAEIPDTASGAQITFQNNSMCKETVVENKDSYILSSCHGEALLSTIVETSAVTSPNCTMEALSLADEGIQAETSALGMNCAVKCEDTPLKISQSIQTDSPLPQICSLSSTSSNSAHTSTEKCNCSKEIKFKSSRACDENLAFKKLYGQLALDLFGMLIRKEKCLRQQQGLIGSFKMELQGLGIFVINEYVYVVKITDLRGNLSKLKEGPTLTYPKNFWFNLKHPKHRLALLCFLFHYYKIERTLKRDTITSLQHAYQ